MFDHFTLAAPFYDRLSGILDPSELISRLRLPAPGGRLLDAGGGTGRVAAVLRPFVAQVVVVDVSLAMLGRAAAKDGLGVVRAPTEWLPFADESFDRIVVVDAFHHFADQQQAVEALWRVLKPTGRLVIEEPSIERWPIKLIALAERLALMRSRFYSPADMAAMLEHAGATVAVHTDHAFNSWVVADKAGQG